MSDCIVRQEAIEELHRLFPNKSMDECKRMLSHVPSVLMFPRYTKTNTDDRKTGTWRLKTVASDFSDSIYAFYICSECGKEAVQKYDWCPYCGTKMKAKNGTEEER